MTDKEAAIAAIAAHQAAIDRGSLKAADHQKSIMYYRRKFDIEPSISFGNINPARDAAREIFAAEDAILTAWKNR